MYSVSICIPMLYVICYENGNLYEKVQGIMSRVMYHVRIYKHLNEGPYT